MCARHLAKYGNQYRSLVKGTSAAEFDSPETLVTYAAHPDPGREEGGESIMPHRSNGSGTNHPR